MVLERAFGRFSRLDDARSRDSSAEVPGVPGAGLGLATVRLPLSDSGFAR
jgi:signal transduction histidine kinase